MATVERVHQGAHRPFTLTVEIHGVAFFADTDAGFDAGVGAVQIVGAQRPTRRHVQVVAVKATVNALAGDLAAVFLGVLLHHQRQLLLQPARQRQAEVPLQHMGHAALAGLGVDAHHFLVAAAQIVGIDGQVRHAPGVARLVLRQTLADRILVAAGEGGEHQIAGVRVTRMGLDLGDLLHQRDDLLHAREIDLRVDALGIEVHARGHQVHVAGALAVAQQGAFHPVGAGHHRQFRRRHAAATVVVGVDADQHVLAVTDVVVDRFHLVGEHIGRAHFHGGGQVDDHPLALVRAPHVVDRVDHLNGEIGLGGTEGFR